MGRRGPQPAPTAHKLAKGETRPSRVNYAEPDLPINETVEPPYGLEGPGREEWVRLQPMLTKSGVLRATDAVSLEDYCRCLTELRTAEEALKSAGLVSERGPEIQRLVLRLRAQASTLRRELGLSPSSRSTIRVTEKPEAKTSNKVANYLSVLRGGVK